MAQNYFKVVARFSGDTGDLYFFDDSDRNAVQGAWDKVTSKAAPRAHISVYKEPPMRGPWDVATVIGHAR